MSLLIQGSTILIGNPINFNVIMELNNLDNMIGGWFIGNFEPSAYKTNTFEVSFKLHPKNQIWDIHYHTVVTEINCIVRGKMIIQNTKLSQGDIFILKPYEIANPIFLEDTEIICVKVPSINDKVCVTKNENNLTQG